MVHFRNLLLVFLLGFGVIFPLVSQTSTDRGQAILTEVDRLSNFEDRDFSAVYTIVSDRPGEDQSVTQARLFRRDRNDQFVILILQPQVQRGQGYLQIDDTVWFYDPESRRFERSSLRDDIQNSDAQNNDLNRSSYTDDYTVESMTEGQLGAFPVYLMDLAANRSDVSYDRVKLWVRKDINLVLKEENYSVNGRLLRTILLPRYVAFGDRYLPTQVLIVDEVNTGQRTQLTVANPSIDAIPDVVFTRQYLERVSN
ncbi:MAG: outer membrane lipoprotein-sorting protein [Spirochaetales bacterium]|nr:outer membrane lipoprotein-sorting protein [Spirochaetales bacterium]